MPGPLISCMAGNPAGLLWLYAALCVLLGSVGVDRARADSATPYGERLIRLEDFEKRRRQLDATTEAAFTEDRQFEAWQAELEDILKQSGPYSADLIEPLQGLTAHYRRQGDLEAAEKSLNRALHLVRVNEGLKSERQLPLLRELINLARQSGDLARVDDRYEYLYFLHGRPPPPYSEEQLVTMLDYFAWQREMLVHGLDGPAHWRRRMVTLIDFNRDVLENFSAPADVVLEQAWRLVQSQVDNFYLLLAYTAFPEEDFRRPPGYVWAASNQEMPDIERRRLSEFRRRAALDGRRLLENYLSHWSHCEGVCWDARLALADWCQWTGQYNRAAAFYRALYRDLNEAGEVQRLANWFDEPVELPAGAVFFVADGAPPGAGLPSFPLRFDVTESGRVMGVTSVAELPEALGPAAARARRALRGTRFRPAYRAGEAVASQGLERRYLWLPLRRSR